MALIVEGGAEGTTVDGLAAHRLCFKFRPRLMLAEAVWSVCRMAMPAAPEARRFYRCAARRSDEAKILLEAGSTTGAMYLSGYGVECMLKALILSTIPAGERAAMLNNFRGAKAHEFNWLRGIWLKIKGAKFPGDVVKHFTNLNSWSTDLRYEPGELPLHEADAFLNSASVVMHWADGRM